MIFIFIKIWFSFLFSIRITTAPVFFFAYLLAYSPQDANVYPYLFFCHHAVCISVRTSRFNAFEIETCIVWDSGGFVIVWGFGNFLVFLEMKNFYLCSPFLVHSGFWEKRRLLKWNPKFSIVSCLWWCQRKIPVSSGLLTLDMIKCVEDITGPNSKSIRTE